MGTGPATHQLSRVISCLPLRAATNILLGSGSRHPGTTAWQCQAELVLELLWLIKLKNSKHVVASPMLPFRPTLPFQHGHRG